MNGSGGPMPQWSGHVPCPSGLGIPHVYMIMINVALWASNHTSFASNAESYSG